MGAIDMDHESLIESGYQTKDELKMQLRFSVQKSATLKNYTTNRSDSFTDRASFPHTNQIK